MLALTFDAAAIEAEPAAALGLWKEKRPGPTTDLEVALAASVSPVPSPKTS